mgnify:CR=1 FL=1
MAGKASPHRAAKRNALIDEATRAYAAQGYVAASLDRVAGGLGRTIGYLRLYFPDKASLIRTVAERHFTRLFAALDRTEPGRDAAGAAPVAALERLVLSYLGYLLGEGAASHRVVQHLTYDPASGLQAELFTMRGWLTALFDDALGQAVPGLGARPELAARLALMLLAMLESLAMPGAATPACADAAPAAETAQLAVACILSAAREAMRQPASPCSDECASWASPV